MYKGYLVLAAALATGGALQASAISGQFSIDGSLTVTLNAMSFTDNSNVANKYVVGPPNPTQSFSSVLLNSEGTIQPLNLTNQPVGTTFSDPNWLTLPVPNNNLVMTLTFIFAGTEGTAQCLAPAAANQVCTPLAGNGQPGPFNLINSASGTTSSALFTFFGTISDGIPADTSNIIGQFSSSFNTPYQTFLPTIVNGGSVTNTFAATFTATPTPEPGAGYLALGGLLVGAALLTRKKLVKV